jgi:hypothetical protein
VGAQGDPAHDVMVVLGVRLLTSQVGRASGIRVTYEVAGKPYAVVDATRIVLCGRAVPVEACDQQ